MRKFMGFKMGLPAALFFLTSCATSQTSHYDDKVEFTEGGSLPGFGYSVVATRSNGDVWTMSGSASGILVRGGGRKRFEMRLPATESIALTSLLSDPALYPQLKSEGCTDYFSSLNIHFEGHDAEAHLCIQFDEMAQTAKLIHLLRRPIGD